MFNYSVVYCIVVFNVGDHSTDRQGTQCEENTPINRD